MLGKSRKLHSATYSSQNGNGLEQDEIEQLLQRIIKLSKNADNPGMAYRNLETIHALAESLAHKLRTD